MKPTTAQEVIKNYLLCLPVTTKANIKLLVQEVQRQQEVNLKYADLFEKREKELEAEIKRLNRKLEYGIGYTANTLMEHNVSAAFIKNYTEKYGDKDEWVNTKYVKELFDIIAQPATNNRQESSEGSK